MEQRCPNCGLFNTPTAATCDCGWSFAGRGLPPARVQAASQKYAGYAQRSWLLPTIAWVSQVILALALRGVSGIALIWLLAMVAQFVLIVAGLYFGLKALMAGSACLPPGRRRIALFGVILSGGTIALIVVLAVCSSM